MDQKGAKVHEGQEHEALKDLSSSSASSVRSMVTSSSSRPLSTPKAAICEVTAERCAEVFGARLRSVVLTGSLARDEATWIEDGEYCKVLGDAEFLLVLESTAGLSSASTIELMREEIENSLERRGIACRVGLSAVHPRYFKRLRPSIFAYELTKCGQVVWGDWDILALVPAFSAEDIPREDAWRLLANRMIELLEVAGAANGTGARTLLPGTVPCNPIPVSCSPFFYCTLKLYLDMATSLLVFAGAYEPTYRGRARALRLLHKASEAGSHDKVGRFPFDLQGLSERVSACTALKLGQDSSAGRGLAPELKEGGGTLWLDAVEYANRLWRWELASLVSERLVGPPLRVCPERSEGAAYQADARRYDFLKLSDRELMRQWMGLQPVGQRLRGWAYVLRRCGWHRSWRGWPRWARLGGKASPRYWVYAAACELFFRLGDLLAPVGELRGADVDIEELASWLPIQAIGDREKGTGKSEHGPAWQRLASEIAWDYHEFLEGTRA
jgi:hypothetical protein